METENEQSLRTRRFRKTFLTGVRALNQPLNDELWNEFKCSANADGPFEELLCEGKLGEALSIFRAHAPFGEADYKRVPEILSRALPRAMTNKISPGSLEDLLVWLDDEVGPNLDQAALRQLTTLTEGVAKNVARKVLGAAEGTKANHDTVITGLKQAYSIANCGLRNKKNRLAAVIEETIDLFESHGLLRPVRVILLATDGDDEERTFQQNLYTSDVEAMILRGVDDLILEFRTHIKPWCDKVRTKTDDALLTFISNPDLMEDPRWASLVPLIACSRVRNQIITLLLQKAQPPFGKYVYALIEEAKLREPTRRDVWEKEQATLVIREIASNYGVPGNTDLVRNLAFLQAHIAAAASSAIDLASFASHWEALVALSTTTELVRVATRVVSLLPEVEITTGDYHAKVSIVMKSIPNIASRSSILQEVLQVCLLAVAEVDDLNGEEETFRYASLGLTLLQFAREEFDCSLLYLNLVETEKVLGDHVLSPSEGNMLDISAVSAVEGTLAAHANESCLRWKNQSSVAMAPVQAIMSSSPIDIIDGCDAIADALVVRDVRAMCAKSLMREDSSVFNPYSFRECPNVINEREVCERLAMTLDERRFSSSKQFSNVKDLETVISLLDLNGALQTCLRLRVHASCSTALIDDILFRLGSAALQRTELDELLCFGYLTALSSPHSATLLFMAEAKRLNDAFHYMQLTGGNRGDVDQAEEEEENAAHAEFDFSRFERLSRLGKNLGRVFKKKQLIVDCEKTERVARWLMILVAKFEGSDFQIDKLKFVKASGEYLDEIGHVLFMRLMSKSDFSFTETKLAMIVEYNNDFASAQSAIGTAQRIARSIARFVFQVVVSDYDIVALVDSLMKWSRHAAKDILINQLNLVCLGQFENPVGGRTIDEGFQARFRLATEMLVGLEPERDAFLKRAQLAGESWIDFQALLANPTTLLISGRARFLDRGEVDVLAMVHSAMEMELPWDEFCVAYLKDLVSGCEMVNFKKELLPLMDCISASFPKKWLFAAQIAGISDFNLSGDVKPLKATRERLQCLKYILKNAKRLPETIRVDDVEEFVRRLEIVFLYENLQVSHEDVNLEQLVKAREVRDLVRLTLERADLAMDDKSVFHAASLIIKAISHGEPGAKGTTSGEGMSLSNFVKRFIIEWMDAPATSVIPSCASSDSENHMAKDVQPQGKSLEKKLQGVIARGLRYIGQQEEFLRKFAYTAGPRQTSNLSKARALSILKDIGKASEEDETELSRREKMAEFEVCRTLVGGKWKQTPEQVFGSNNLADRLQAAEGLLRDMPEKHPLRCALLVSDITEDCLLKGKLMDRAGVLTKALECVLDASGCQEDRKFSELLNILERLPLHLISQLSDSRIWASLSEHFVKVCLQIDSLPDARINQQRERLTSYIRLLERCSLEDTVASNVAVLHDALQGRSKYAYLFRRTKMLIFRLSQNE